jgi:GDP/UDP-N,N'-diacetylbacillosamine 2-epimerase (hydrolysing)
MKIGVLTSSRADYGIYKPLLDKLKADSQVSIHLIAFGMHIQSSQGNTLSIVESDGYENLSIIGCMPENDAVYDIAKGYASIVSSFVDFWDSNSFDIVFALGDRWEMSAAVQASIPFQIRLAHIHGGETTLGAIDNLYRHQITLASKVHFTASQEFSNRVEEMVGSSENVFTTGSISIDDLANLSLPAWPSVQKKFQIPFEKFILVTIHPESVKVEMNQDFALISFEVLSEIAKTNNILITRANSDALGSLYNKQFERLQVLCPGKVRLVESLGKLNYFKAMQQCEFMLGNTSSGIIEGASFKKWVINIGERQKGRLRSKNTIDVSFDVMEINDAINKVSGYEEFKGINEYWRPNSCEVIIKAIKKFVLR